MGAGGLVWEAETGQVGYRRMSWLQKCVTHLIYLPAVKSENLYFFFLDGS